MRYLVIFLAGAVGWAVQASPGGETVPQEVPTLVGFAQLPAETFRPGPTSGQFIAPANGLTPPFVGQQPVQGISAIVRAGDQEFLALTDNGFGAKGNSPDHVLRVHRLRLELKTERGGSGTVTVRSQITLSDPRRLVPFALVADAAVYPGGRGGLPVDPAIVRDRLLTGSDFDPESLRVALDGSMWFGDEFGPFLLHTDAAGALIDAPIGLDGVRSPQHPTGGPATLGNSRGFEGMAMLPDGTRLYPMLEGPVSGEPAGRLRIHEFDTTAKRYTPNRWTYPLDQPNHAIGDFTAITTRVFLVIERDEAQGAAAKFKKIFRVDLDVVGTDGLLLKRELVDLLNVADPHRLGSTAPVFRFPFQTIESVLPLSATEILVVNDNNFPFGNARRSGTADATEFIVIRHGR